MQCQDIMEKDVECVSPRDTVEDAAIRMRDEDVGFLPVCDQSKKVLGTLTDRDIVVRAVAEDLDPKTTTLSDICSRDLVTVSADDSAETALDLMRTHALRRLPVVDRGAPVGIVSIGDLATGREAGSALSEISSASPNT